MSIFNKLIVSGLLVTSMCSTEALADVNIATLTQAQGQAIINNPMGNFYNWKVKGVCSWLTMCTIFPCTIQTSFVQHYQPDLVVSVFPEKGKNPFTEANSLIDVPMEAIGQAEMQSIMGVAGGIGHSGSKPSSTMNRFYEVDVFGNPGASAIGAASSLYAVPVTTAPYMPYYSSLLDMYLWHNPTLEITLHPQSYIPFMDNEGSTLAPWGSLYPRTGFVAQLSKFKAAAMVALRATHLATREGQMHMSTTAPKTGCGEKCQVIRDPDINDNDSVKFQLVYPEIEDKFDEDDFGKNDMYDLNITNTYRSDITQKGEDRYTWLAWRKYEGCVPGKGKLISVIRT